MAIKRYFLVILFIQCFIAFGQRLINNPILMHPHDFPCFAEKTEDNPIIEEINKAPGDVLFSANFSNANSVNNWTKTGPDGALWMRDQDGPSGQFANSAVEIINSQSAGNGFLIFDADLSNPGLGPYASRSGSIASPAINLSGVPAVIIEFQHKYRVCCNNAFFPRLEVSTNDFTTYATYDVSIPGTANNAISGTYQSKVNVAAFLDTASNLTNFKFRFNFLGAGGTTHYYWQVDDIKVKEAYLYDLVGLSNYLAVGQMKLPYYFIPQGQLSPIEFSGAARADGALEHTGSHLNVAINLGGGSVSSDSVSIQSGQIDSLITATWIPPLGVDTMYTLSYNFALDSLDALPLDNIRTDDLYITDFVYGVDNNNYSNFISNLDTQPLAPFKVGNVMEVMADDMIDSMMVCVTATSTNVGQFVFGEILKSVNGSWQYLGSTALHEITPDFNGSFIRMPMMYPTIVHEGDTILVLAGHPQSNNGSDVRFRVAQAVEEGLVQGFDANNNLFYLPDPHAVIVRLRMHGYLEISENNNTLNSLNIYPNPVSTELVLEYNNLGVSEDMELVITDLKGQVLKYEPIQYHMVGKNIISVDCENLSSGYYFIHLFSKESQLTGKFVKQ
jgi:hypothetical protein